MLTNENWLKWIVYVVFKTIRCRFIFVTSFPTSCVSRCLNFQINLTLDRTKRDREAFHSYYTSLDSWKHLRHVEAFECLKSTWEHLGTCNALEALWHFRGTWGTWTFEHFDTWKPLKVLAQLSHLILKKLGYFGP